jgi:hypothetical protein
VAPLGNGIALYGILATKRQSVPKSSKKIREKKIMFFWGWNSILGANKTSSSKSKWIAAQSLSHIPVAKRGGHLVLGLTSGMLTPSTLTMKVYEEIYGGEPGHIEALRELFLLDGDVGARKRQRRHSATWA